MIQPSSVIVRFTLLYDGFFDFLLSLFGEQRVFYLNRPEVPYLRLFEQILAEIKQGVENVKI